MLEINDDVFTLGKQLNMRMLVINPLNRAPATQLLKGFTIRKENLMGGDFLRT